MVMAGFIRPLPLLLVPDAVQREAISAFTRVFDALWRVMHR
jgi:hypothetical protein